LIPNIGTTKKTPGDAYLTKLLIQYVEYRLLLKVFIDKQCNDMKFEKLKELLIIYSPSIIENFYY
jgi:hypothetical protein